MTKRYSIGVAAYIVPTFLLGVCVALGSVQRLL